MNPKLRRWVAGWVPPHVRKWLRGSGEEVRYSGSYASWAEARQASTGYDAPAILDKVLRSTQEVIAGRAAFERDSVAFPQPEYSFPLLACLLREFERRGRPIRVLDVGGALGSSYWQSRRFLRSAVGDWCVVEQEAFVKCGREHIAGGVLRFEASLADELAQRPDVALLSGVLPYVEGPHELLKQVAAAGLDCVIVDRTPVWDLPDRLTVQSVPPYIYGVAASYPAWILYRQGLLAHFQTGQPSQPDVIEFAAISGAIDVDGDWAKDAGFCVR